MKEDLAKLHHARSKKDYPELELEEDEFVELDIRRSRYGLLGIWSLTVLVGLIILIVSMTVNLGGSSILHDLGFNPDATTYLYLIFLILFGVVILCAFVVSKVYNANRMFVTNRRIFHYESISLFAKSVNVIDLNRIEDVSFRQNGLLDHIFRLGTIRLSTVGDETTYTFKYVDTPTDELKTIMHLVHNRKGIKKN
ncbi:PH domain-containing protein [Candidatus Saccharibacteria bacterium]|nr:PH domain-containing protein [Candidatus Saccharibacteria bacterium]